MAETQTYNTVFRKRQEELERAEARRSRNLFIKEAIRYAAITAVGAGLLGCYIAKTSDRQTAEEPKVTLFAKEDSGEISVTNTTPERAQEIIAKYLAKSGR